MEGAAFNNPSQSEIMLLSSTILYQRFNIILFKETLHRISMLNIIISSILIIFQSQQSEIIINLSMDWIHWFGNWNPFITHILALLLINSSAYSDGELSLKRRLSNQFYSWKDGIEDSLMNGYHWNTRIEFKYWRTDRNSPLKWRIQENRDQRIINHLNEWTELYWVELIDLSELSDP